MVVSDKFVVTRGSRPNWSDPHPGLESGICPAVAAPILPTPARDLQGRPGSDESLEPQVRDPARLEPDGLAGIGAGRAPRAAGTGAVGEAG